MYEVGSFVIFSTPSTSFFFFLDLVLIYVKHCCVNLMLQPSVMLKLFIVAF